MSRSTATAYGAMPGESARTEFVIIEPQCRGFEHAKVNASFLVGFCGMMGRGETTLLLAEESHLQDIRRELGPATHGIRYGRIRVPARDARGYRRLLLECLCMRSIQRRIPPSADRAKIVFLSGTPQTLLAMRLTGRGLARRKPALILHSVLETLLPSWRTKAVWELPLSLKNVLRLAAPREIEYTALSERTYANLKRVAPGLFLHLRWTDLPCWPQPSGGGETMTRQDAPVTIGAIGVGHRAKGTDLLLQLSVMLRDTPNVRFVLIGHMKDWKLGTSKEANVEILSAHGAMTSSDMRVAIEGLDYTLFLFRPGSYVLTETASFLDAVSCAKPIIALRSEIMEDKLAHFGDIGYMGDDLADVAGIIRRIALHLPVEDYKRQARNMVLASRALLPEKCAARITSGE